MENKKLYDAYGNLVELTENDFKLVQVDKKIHDKKFETKATTYGKDALKRFVKNKSSVVGFFIIALLLLLALVYPALSPYDVNNIHPKEALLKPRAVTPTKGSWSTTFNGCKLLTNVAYDVEFGAPISEKNNDGTFVYYNKNAIVTLETYESKINITSNSNKLAHGGVLVLGAHKANNTSVSNLYVYEDIDFNIENGYKLNFKAKNVDLTNIADFKDYANLLAEYRLYIKYDNENELSKNGKFFIHNKNTAKDLILTDGVDGWTKSFEEFNINISEKIKEAGLTELKNGRIYFEIKCSEEGYTYLPIEKFQLTVDKEDAIENVMVKSDLTGEFEDKPYSAKEVFNLLSLNDANEKKSIALPNDGSVPLGYWKGTAYSYVYNATYITSDFIFDYYEDTFGNKDIKEVDIIKLRQYKQKGWCDFDESTPENIAKTFVVKSDLCPVNKVISSKEIMNSAGEKSIEIVTNTCMYKYYGYKTMPKYLLGTDNSGKDLITMAFKGLRTSLLLSICVSAVCLTFGLCWGAISGYFGGNVDLFMERFCDILGGVPWIVVMTLAILLLGNNIGTFAMALCLTGWMGTAARTRTQFYRFKGREYILASRTLGSSDKRLIFRHILPNSLGTIVTGSVLSIPGVIFSESTLSYLNLGLQGSDSFGNILSNNQQYINSYPALIIFPAIIISLIMISFNLFGNGLRDALNPSLKGSE